MKSSRSGGECLGLQVDVTNDEVWRRIIDLESEIRGITDRKRESTAASARSVTSDQRKLAFALWNELEVISTFRGVLSRPAGQVFGREERLTFSSTVLGRTVRTWSGNGLDEAEASKLIDALTHVKAFQAL